MKKFLCLFTVGCMMLGITACGNAASKESEEVVEYLSAESVVETVVADAVENAEDVKPNENPVSYENMQNITLFIEDSDIRKEDEGSPCDVFCMTFSYDSERPEFVFISPSGKEYHVDCQSDIDGGDNELSVSANDEWTSVALPGEIGEWIMYYDKKGNEYIDYSVVSF